MSEVGYLKTDSRLTSQESYRLCFRFNVH